jgi:hypothetical protein
MKIKIISRWNIKKILFETDAENIGAAVAAALAIHADLCGANLCCANLRGANLCGADLCSADLRGANLCGASLCGADLCGASLCGASLCDANLCGADLRGADLRGASLRGASLCGASLCDANLCGSDLKTLLPQRTILPDGDLIGWKKLQGGTICKLQIPLTAKRVGGLIGRKCRAEYAVVLEGEGEGLHNGHVYKVGDTVKPDKYDPNPLVECSNGIHFFISKQEAMDYN